MLFRLANMKMSIVVTVPVAGLCATLYYIYLKSRDKPKEKPSELTEEKIKKPKMIEIEVPRELVPEIVGINGSKIKGIESESKATINLRKEGASKGTRTCQIMGTSESCEKAKIMILEIKEMYETLESEIVTVEKEYESLLRDETKFINSICDQSSAMIEISEDDRGDSGAKFINIVGTKHQIMLAKRLILQALRRFKIDKNLRKDKPKEVVTNGFLESDILAMKVKEETNDEKFAELSKKIEGPGYISAFIDLDDVYIQNDESNSIRCELEEKMTRYYSTIGKFQILKSSDIGIKHLVAAQYGDSEIWSRACISEIQDDDEEGKSIGLDFIDYGDGDFKKPSDLRYLEKEFLSIPPLAFRCALENPRSCDWPPFSFDEFTEIVPVATCYVVTIKCVGKKSINGHGEVPLVRIIDHQSPDKRNISLVIEQRLYK